MLEDICPEEKVIHEIIIQVILPRVEQIELEFGKLSYRCSVYTGDIETYFKIVDSSGQIADENDRTQPIRMRFRPIFDPNKLKFRIESIYSKDVLPENEEFSGFQTEGIINTMTLNVKNPTWTVRYMQRSWKDWWK
ncbi:MAG TPA: hypothetical protein VF941_19515 [Clostridia bacterium]